MRPYVMTGLLAAAVAVLLGCASTTVRKNPGPHDHGLRYYLPKPYLLVTQSTKTDANKSVIPVHGKVTLAVEMRQDFSEEYSIHVRSGVGINKTTITLDEGWKLKAVDMTLDANFAANVDAISSVLGVAKDLKPSGGPTEKEGDRNVLADDVTARNVPLGYYESVLGFDAEGKKQLYGWRYVGFLPFANCPTNMVGVQPADCTTGDLYGLVMDKNIMVFKKLDVLKGEAVAPRPATVK